MRWEKSGAASAASAAPLIKSRRAADPCGRPRFTGTVIDVKTALAAQTCADDGVKIMLTWLSIDQKEVLHAIRTAVAAVSSLSMARFCRLPESYWAAITTIVVMQSTLGAAWAVSKERFAGTALGAAVGAVVAVYAAQNVAAFGAGVFVLGLVCGILRIGRNAFRYAGITLAIVMLLARAEPAWMTAINRFLEISLGVGAGLLLTAVWPEPEPAAD